MLDVLHRFGGGGALNMKKKEQLESDLCEICPFVTEGEGVQQRPETSFSLMLGEKMKVLKASLEEIFRIVGKSIIRQVLKLVSEL